MIDITSWGVGKIAQLPDHAFGQKWQVITQHRIAVETTVVWMAKQSIPDKIMLWGITASGFRGPNIQNGYKFAMADQEPADETAFNLGQRIFKGDLDSDTVEGLISTSTSVEMEIKTRIILEPGGRRFTQYVRNGHATTESNITIQYLISSIPRSIPEWLVSKQE